MSEPTSETTEEPIGGEPPAGFPSGEGEPLDIEADADARAMAALLGRQERGDGDEEPSPDEPAPEDPPPDETAQGSEEPREETAETTAQTTEEGQQEQPELSEALASVMAMRTDLEAKIAEVEKRTAELAALEEQRKELEPFTRFAQKAKGENLFAALQELFPERKPDDMVRAIAEGRGLERPEEKLESGLEKIRAEVRSEIEKFETMQKQREDAEVDHVFTTTVTGGLDDAPLVAAFGEQGLAAVRQVVDTQRQNGSRVTGDIVRKALEEVEGELVANFLTRALQSEAVRTKYAEQLRKVLPGKSDTPAPVPSGRSLSNRVASSQTRRAPTEALTEEERDELALRHLRR